MKDAHEVLKYISFDVEKFKERSLIICGHSMGGAIASKLVTNIAKFAEDAELYKKIKSVFVIDVVEGSAIEALPLMEQIVRNRPPCFNSL